MNRELKFRVWNTLTKKTYHTGFAVQANGHVTLDGSLIKDDNLAAGWKIYENEGELIPQQFTSLKDKNGKEIYEGDIIEFSLKDFKQTYQIYWNQEMLRWDYTSLKDNIEDPCACEYDLFERNFSNSEIVGNIFENLELFKECKLIR